MDPDQLASSDASGSGSTLFSEKGKKFENIMRIVCFKTLGRKWYLDTTLP